MLVILIILLLLATIIYIVSNKPDKFHIERSVTIAAPPEVIIPQLSNFSNWKNWSPWEKIDPRLQRHYSGPAEGPGAVYAWRGNNKVGEGLMEITSADDYHLVIRLEFFKPFAANNRVELQLTPNDSYTRVTWTMEGQNQLGNKFAGLLLNMDKLIGKDFETGLSNLKQVCETHAHTSF